MEMVKIGKMNTLETIRQMYGAKYRKGGYFGALWAAWLKTGMTRAERARHLLVLIEIKAENATENGKTILRERYRRVLEIEKSARRLN